MIAGIKLLFEGLNVKAPKETPKRFAQMLVEMTSYQNVSNKKIAEEINKTFECDFEQATQNMVFVKDIECFGYCEHHVALIYDMKISVAYFPQKFIVGLSKIVRACDMICKRLQLQEKIGTDVMEVLKILTKSDDIAVYIEAKHSCVTARGIKNPNVKTITTNFGGIFSKKSEVRDEFFKVIKK